MHNLNVLTEHSLFAYIKHGLGQKAGSYIRRAFLKGLARTFKGWAHRGQQAPMSHETAHLIFSSPEPLGSQGELIVYPWSRRPSVRPSSVVCPPFSKIFSSETAWPIKAKFYVEPPWEGGTKVYIYCPGHMTKMAALPIYGKNL